MRLKSLGVLICSLLLILQPAFGAASAAIGTVNGNGKAQVNGVSVPNGAVLYSGDHLATRSGGTAFVYLAKGDKLALGASTVAQVMANDKGFTVSLHQGRIAAVAQAGVPIVVEADGATIEPKLTSGSYEVALDGNELRVLSRSGTTLAEAPNRTIEVGEGKLLRAKMVQAPSSQGPSSQGNKKKKRIIGALILAGVAGVGLGIALTGPGKKCASPVGFSCP